MTKNLSANGLYSMEPSDKIETYSGAHQFMKELFPAEWLPIKRTVIFFRGGSRERPRVSAIFINPARKKNGQSDRFRFVIV